METPPPDKASMDPSVATDVRVEEDEASADGEDDGEGSKLLYINREKKRHQKEYKNQAHRRELLLSKK